MALAAPRTSGGRDGLDHRPAGGALAGSGDAGGRPGAARADCQPAGDRAERGGCSRRAGTVRAIAGRLGGPRPGHEHPDRGARAVRARRSGGSRSGARTRRGSPRRGSHRRPRSGEPGRARRRPGCDRIDRGELRGRRRRSLALGRAVRPAGHGGVQGDQHLGQHDRPPLAALLAFRTVRGAPGRLRQLAAGAAFGAPDPRGGAVPARHDARRRLARHVARCVAPSLGQRRLARGGDGGRAGPEARGSPPLCRRTGRRRLDGQRPRRRDFGRHPSRAPSADPRLWARGCPPGRCWLCSWPDRQTALERASASRPSRSTWASRWSASASSVVSICCSKARPDGSRFRSRARKAWRKASAANRPWT